MGSLVGGWDVNAPGLPPPEYADYDDTDNGNTGYFAKLERSKSLRRQSSGGNPDAAPHLERLPTSPSNEFQSFPSRRLSSGTLGRSSLPFPGPTADSAGGLAGSLGRTSLTRVSPPGSSALARSLSLGREGSRVSGEWPTTQSHHSLDAQRAPAPKSLKDQYKWWNKMSSSALNEAADEAPTADSAAAAPYRPQFHLTGQTMNYRPSASMRANDGGAAPTSAPQVQASA